MRDIDKTKGQLVDELAAMRQRTSELETSLGERKTMHEALRESEQNFRALAENSLDAITVFSEEGIPVYANRRAAEITGYSIAERTNKTFLEFVHPEESEKLMERFKRRIEGKPVTSHYETVIVRMNGRSLPIELASTRTVWRGKPAVLVVYRDIAERKMTEEALRDSEEKLRLMFESVDDGIAVTDLEGTITEVNSRGLELYGASTKSEVLGKSAFELIAPADRESALAAMQRTLEQGASGSIEYTLARADGSEYLGELNASLLRDGYGNPAGFIAIVRDITERKQAEEARLAALKRVSDVIEAMPDALIMLDTNGNVLQINSAYTKMFGLKTKEVVGKNIMELPTMRPEDAEKGMKLMKEVLETGGTEGIDMVVYTKWGKEFPINATGTIVKDAEGNPTYFVSTMRDITERKQAEEALRESEERFRALIENALDAIVILNSDGTIRYESPSMERMTGRKAKVRIGKDPLEFSHPDDIPNVIEAFAQLLENQTTTVHTELRLQHEDGSWRTFEVVGNNLLDNPAVAGTVLNLRDITQRKRAEEETAKAKAYLESALTSTPDGVLLMDRQGRFTYVNAAFLKWVGRAAQDFIGKTVREISPPLMSPETTEIIAERVSRRLETGNPIAGVEVEVIDKDGKPMPISYSAAGIRDEVGSILGEVVFLGDITERKKMEEALRESERNYRVLFESTIDGAVVIDAETMKVVLANQTAARMYGFSMEEVTTANLLEYIHPDDRDRALNAIAEDMFEKDLRQVEEFRTLTKDGGVRWIAGVGTRVEYQGRLAGLISFRDITEQKRTDERLRELYEQERESRQRVEAEMKRRVEFTRALAHELKTPLTSVLASSDLLASELHDEPLLSLARNISQGASSLNSRIDELLDLARGEVGMLQLKLEPVDLLQLLRETADSMRPLASSHGQSLTLDLPPSLSPVRADAARVQQVITNLLGNAFKFTPVAGSITLRAKEKDAALVVEVRDTGPGMSKEEQKRLFEPYHRLHREPSGGLGLGLSLCKTLVELHGGQIWVRSNVGRGSTFGFSLPLEAADEQAVESEMPTKLWKVLIIEDDQEIVSFVSVAFQMRWPEAQLISSSLGEEGLELVETENPDLVILDLGLPDTSGFEVLRQVRLFSSVPVVILTVRADEADMVKGLEWGADDYVVKPFRQLELLARLKVQLRKQIPPGEEAPIICGSLRLDPSTYQLTYGGKEISLTIVEGRIMQYLMQNAGHVITHSRLAEAVWEEDHPGAVDSLRVYIRYLREKLEEDPSHPQLILTKVGIGYLLAKSV